MKLFAKDKLRCPTCGATMVPAKNINKGTSSCWFRCSSKICRTFVDTYLPLPHQIMIHQDPREAVGVFGGYGSGKTFCSMKDDQKHILSTPNGTTVVGSAILAQVEQTFEKDFRNDFPAELLLHENKQKKTYTFINGHQLLIKSYYEEELLRSLTVSRYHIVEASAVEHDIFVQLTTRLRHLAGTVPETDEEGRVVFDDVLKKFRTKYDWRKGIIESNPDSGWIRNEFLLKSSYIFPKEHARFYNILEPNKDYASYIFPTNMNIHLPENFIESLKRGKPEYWIRRYLEGSFDYAEGLVYPAANHCIIQPFAIPEDWKRFVAMDYGINDETAFLFGAIDQREGIAYIIHEIYVNNKDYKALATLYKKDYLEVVPKNNLLSQPVMDGRSISKRNDYNLKKIGELFAEEGVFFKPAQMDLQARILKTSTFLGTGMIKIFSNCVNLIKEISNYKYPDREVSGRSKGDKPVDARNHAVNALEFAIMELPDDLTNISNMAYDNTGAVLFNYSRATKNQRRFNPFEDEQDFSPEGEGFSGIYKGLGSW